MVDMRATNAKLRRRSEIMVSQITGCDDATAVEALARADGDLKTAALIALGTPASDAQDAFTRYDGNLREAMAEISKAKG